MTNLLDKAIQELPAESSILFGVLNWGLGHASRSAVIIKKLILAGHKVVLASDGAAKLFLETIFPDLESRELPSYNISYKYKSMPLNMLLQGPNIVRAVSREHKVLNQWQAQQPFDLIISDNRYGLYVEGLPSILISHQFNLQADQAVMAWLANVVLKRYLRSFTRYWCPDFEDRRLSGKLSQSTLDICFIGPLSLLKKLAVKEDIDLLFLLSGPEPQRGKLEELLLQFMEGHPAFTNKKVVLIRGKIRDEAKLSTDKIEIKNYLLQEELSSYIQRSRLVICRSGYSTIMDLEVLGKKAIFIPTPGQTEQEYLAKSLSKVGTPYTWIAQKDVEAKLVDKIAERV